MKDLPYGKVQKEQSPKKVYSRINKRKWMTSRLEENQTSPGICTAEVASVLSSTCDRNTEEKGPETSPETIRNRPIITNVYTRKKRREKQGGLEK